LAEEYHRAHPRAWAVHTVTSRQIYVYFLDSLKMIITLSLLTFCVVCLMEALVRMNNSGIDKTLWIEETVAPA
jgi:hypothetical protein